MSLNLGFQRFLSSQDKVPAENFDCKIKSWLYEKVQDLRLSPWFFMVKGLQDYAIESFWRMESVRISV
ncbi:hypothetical protein HHI36_021250 [Cryptolaemus montrouzieri]|uniref:Uncharacterized protein n=1 Tax=Cryptolaemus montrouzieri TaxID=559131 RepID=A0ABD2MX66_9CUCU